MFTKVLVTGATGFIGSHLCEYLRGIAAEVHGVSRQVHERSDSVRWWQADLRDDVAALTVIRRVSPEIIFHLAGHVTGDRSVDHVLPAFEGNLLTSLTVLRAATIVGCRRIVLVGSCEEPDGGTGDAICCSPYAASKSAMRSYARTFHRLYNTPVVISRVFMVYGPGRQDQRKLVPYVISNLMTGKAPDLMSGSREVDWIYVEDVAQGLLRASLAPGIEGTTIELGTGRLATVREVVDQLTSLIQSTAKPVFGALPDRPFERIRAANIADTQAKLAWRPAVELEEGLLRTVEWFRENLEVQREFRFKAGG